MTVGKMVRSWQLVNFENIFLGKTLVEVDQGTETIYFTDEFGFRYGLWHDQDCCESVYISDVCGSWDDILNSPLLKVSETTQDMPDASESGTWTFYTFTTFKGTVTLRWSGESNGYYSERVSTYAQI